ncbi:MAG: SH3 domain-containing protein [Candidatus Binatia bacterium]
MTMTARKINRWAAGLAVLVAVAGCKKATDVVDPKSLPDLNAQIRPYVTVESASVKTGPGVEFRTIAQLKPNSRVNAVGRDGDWILIVSRKGNAPGFIPIAAVKPSTGEEQESSTPPVKGKYEVLINTQVRSGPGLHYPAVADIPKGTAINVVNEEKGWFRVESKRGNQPGYVEASLARPKTSQ